eukprot:scaffold19132_cov31-Tisochrysis_lutea.AAC.2
MHAHKLGHSNAIVLAMDRELANEMLTRKIPVFDNSINLDAWNSTCLQRHIQVSCALPQSPSLLQAVPCFLLMR